MTRWPKWWPWAAGGVLVALILTVAVVVHGWRDDPPDVQKVEQRAVEQAVSDATTDSLVTALVARDDSITAENARLREHAAVATAIGQQARRAASAALDSARALLMSDPAAATVQYEAAIKAKSEEADSAWAVAAAERERADNAVALANAWRVTADTLRASRDEWRGIAEEERAIRERTVAAARCRIAGLLPCPSRTAAAVGGAALGAVGAVYLSRE